MRLNERDPNDKTPFSSIEHDLTVEQRKEIKEIVVSTKEEQRNQPEGWHFSDLCEVAFGHHEDGQDRHKNWEVGYLGKEVEASFKVEYDVTGRAQCRQCSKKKLVVNLFDKSRKGMIYHYFHPNCLIHNLKRCRIMSRNIETVSLVLTTC